MPVYISILRGINVGGHKMIKMDALRSMYEHLGFTNVKTYIQSGNVIFTSLEIPLPELSNLIILKIQETFGFDVPVLVLSQSEIKVIIQNNPFIINKDVQSLHVTFLSDIPQQADIDAITGGNYGNDEFAVSGRAVYLFCPGPYHATKLSNTFFEKKLRVSATTRNWKTVVALAEMAFL